MENVIELNLSSRRWQVLQPAIYLISILPGLVWGFLLPPTISKWALGFTTLSVVLIQHGVNVFNDVIDWKKGADSEKQLSWVRFHDLNLSVAQLHGWVSFVAGVSLGSSLVIAYQRFEVFYVALPLVLLGYGYNASQWTLSYTALGEWVTALCYGPGVFGCMGYLLTGTVTWSHILGSLGFAFLSVSVLFSHQPPQILNDFLAGKLSFAVRNGAEKTKRIAQVFHSISLLLLTGIFFQFENTLWNFILVWTLAGLWALRAYKIPPTPKTILNSALMWVLGSLILKLLGVFS
ncbi:MAG: prenyltransferase [Deltaproteobacteria bacterium]